ncbi:MAG: FkbM family methyltransferase [Rhodospirillales bacterium]|nr:FkbM family methyltransferase [Rhodospirillales bacterium]
MIDRDTPLDPALPEQRRIRLTIGCRDADVIPKVPDAGRVLQRDGDTVQVMHNGIVVEAGGYFGDWMQEIIRRLGGHHEPQEELAFARVLERLESGATMIELGSFWAYYSLWFRRALPGSTNVCVEPDEERLALGKRNFARNGYDATFLPYAIGSGPGDDVEFLRERDGSTVRVPMRSVDAIVDELRLRRIDLLHVDIQGFETAMLEGARRLIGSGNLRFLIVSTHHWKISGDALTHQRCVRRIEQLGGRILLEHSVPESASGDGLIVASFDARDADMPPIEISRVRARDSLFGELEHDLAAAQGLAPLED